MKIGGRILLALGAALALAAIVAATATASRPASHKNAATFKLVPNAKFVPCFARSTESEQPPTATVTVQRGSLNDTLTVHLRNFKSNLGFDLFTVQHSPFDASGQPDPAFTGSFGLAWYQSDIETNGKGSADVTIKTILLDQIFGFDADVGLTPVSTFHVGFWFNNPKDAAPCGFDPSKPTPFNGEHDAGPFAMISKPTSAGVGPLCTHPSASQPSGCNP